MLKQFLNHIHQNDLCKQEQKILLAVSGGLDSSVMLSLFKEAGFSIGAAHCNFQLRGEESHADEQFVQQLCEELGVTFYTKRFDTDNYSNENKLSIQMGARELRYAWFNELMKEQKFDLLATAHHFNDSIETVLLNWVNGKSLDSFAGISVKRNKIIRPMLFAVRDEIERYAKEKDIKWREDQSNATDDYQRNFIRHHVIPKLKEINPSLESTLIKSQKKIEGELSVLNQQTEKWRQENLIKEGDNFYIEKKSITHVSLLWRVVRDFGFNFDQCEAVIRALHDQSGKQFLSAEYQLTIDREGVIISVHQNFWKEVTIEDGQSQAVLGSWEMEIKKLNSIKVSSDSLAATLDADKIRFPLQWRKWKEGDFFYPLRMEHKRKLSDFLIDNKVSLADKNVVTVLESATGEIIWVVGYRIDNRFKITPQTRSALTFSIAPYFV